jgi:hypothetical protein
MYNILPKMIPTPNPHHWDFIHLLVHCRQKDLTVLGQLLPTPFSAGEVTTNQEVTCLQSIKNSTSVEVH